MVEHFLAKEDVESSSLFARSTEYMINKSNLDVDLNPLVSWLDSKMESEPAGRINNSTGTRKPNGAQHTISQRDRIFHFLFAKINSIAKEKFSSYAITDVWTNVNLPEGYNKSHIHIGADIAGCFYIRVPENSGDIEFETGERFTPKAGDIYWWDASIPHWVHKNESGEVRYSVAFNVKRLDV